MKLNLRTIAMYGTLLAVVGCISTGTLNSSDFNFNLDLVRPHSESIYKERDLDPPYVARFQKNNKTLIYIAAVHEPSVKFPNLLDSPTFLTITKAFKENAIDAVIVEGITSWDGALPDKINSHIDQCHSTGYQTNCGEPWYTMHLAKERNISMISGEPKESEILKFLESKGFERSDLLGFYVTRQIPEWKRTGQHQKNKMKILISNLLSVYEKNLGGQQKFGYEEFRAWYASHVKTPSNYLNIETSDVGPYWRNEASYLQKISGLVRIVRDRVIVQRTADMLKTHSTVLVVYGASHLLTQLPAFEQKMSKAINTKWY
ncbi:hypothetical protein CIK05_09730 [Bdellovibrio sp. qaytius]|nr:hypothetical protein CIK05_09730 [Bdellovibrio sp. qaytius]